MEAQASTLNAATTLAEPHLKNVDCGVIELPDGDLVAYRPIQPEDAPALQHFHRRLSPYSIYLRFFGAMPELSERMAGYFTSVDVVNGFGRVATAPGRPDAEPAQEPRAAGAVVDRGRRRKRRDRAAA